MTNFWESIKKSGSEDVVLSRFERGLKVGRVLNPEKGPFEDMTYFNVFGPTIIASNDTIEPVLGSRTVSIVMKKSRKSFKGLVDVKYGQRLQEELIAFRLNCLKFDLPETEKLVDGRFGDILRPLHQIVKFVNPEKEQEFIQVVQALQSRRQSGKAETLEAEIITQILKLKNEVYNNNLPEKMIVNAINKDRSEREQYTSQKIARRLNIMGFQKSTIHGGNSAINWNEDLLKERASEYGVDTEEETSPSSLSSPSSPSSPTSTTTEELTTGQIEEIFKPLD
jgi:hypothetical protein